MKSPMGAMGVAVSSLTFRFTLVFHVQFGRCKFSGVRGVTVHMGNLFTSPGFVLCITHTLERLHVCTFCAPEFFVWTPCRAKKVPVTWLKHAAGSACVLKENFVPLL